MRVVLQRASEASVKIDGEIHGEIKHGLVVFLGIEHEDEESDVVWLIEKMTKMRIFNDDEGKMNLSLLDVRGALLIISQFTLHASTKKGNRPSYVKSARPEAAVPLYESFITKAKSKIRHVQTGEFGADMKVSLINDGPVTIILDSRNRE